jgi:hypothetical protein
MASRLSSLVLKILGFAPIRAIYLGLTPLFELAIRVHFHVRTKLSPPGTGLAGRYQSVIEDGLRVATPTQREQTLETV